MANVTLSLTAESKSLSARVSKVKVLSSVMVLCTWSTTVTVAFTSPSSDASAFGGVNPVTVPSVTIKPSFATHGVFWSALSSVCVTSPT